MPARIGDRLPAWLISELAPDVEEAPSYPAYILVTIGSDGWPHVALLSVGELQARGARELVAALWPGTTTSQNLMTSGRALLQAAGPVEIVNVRLTARRCPDLPIGRGRRHVYRLEVRDVHRDVVGFAALRSGYRFALTKSSAWASWMETIAALVADHCGDQDPA